MHDLSAIDLNLLPLLDSLLSTGSVSASARQLGRTQSGLSHALTRLRDLFDDPLLVRTGNQMTLTPTAESLRGPARLAVAQLSALIARRGFDPKESQRSFHIGASGYASAVIIPDLMKRLSVASPGLRLHVHSSGDKVDRLVRDGELDLALGSRYQPLSGVLRGVLGKDRFVVVMRKNHPQVSKTMNLNQYCRLEHVLVSPRGNPGSTVDRALAGLDRQRETRLVTDSFMLALYTVSRSDLVTTLPAFLVKNLASEFDLHFVSPPKSLGLGPIELTMIYGEVKRDDVAHRWLRDQVAALVKG